MTTETFTGPATETFADLRRLHGPSQDAFARKAKITQKQVSELERGKVAPHDETIRRIAENLGLHEGEVRDAIERTREVLRDPELRLTYRLQRAVADLYPRHSESGRVDMSGLLVGLGQQLLLGFAKRKPVKWFHIGQTAYDAYRALENDGWHDDHDRAVSRAAFLAISRLVYAATNLRPQPFDVSDWERHAVALVRAVDTENVDRAERFDEQLLVVFDNLLRVAVSDPGEFVKSAFNFRRVADDVLLRPVAGGALSPAQAQLFAARALVLGVREGLRPDADDIDTEIDESALVAE